VVPGAADLDNYYRLVERVGELPASALAATAWRFLEETAGPQAAEALARTAFGRKGTRDVRDWLYHRRFPAPALVAESSGRDFATFVAAWQRWLADQAAARTRWLGSLPTATVAVELSARTLDAVTVRGQLRGAEADDCAVLHTLEPFYDTIPNPDLFTEDKLPAAPTGAFTMPLDADYESGERVFLALECRSPATPWGLRLHAGRVTVP
jgi:hypothetical protein